MKEESLLEGFMDVPGRRFALSYEKTIANRREDHVNRYVVNFRKFKTRFLVKKRHFGRPRRLRPPGWLLESYVSLA